MKSKSKLSTKTSAEHVYVFAATEGRPASLPTTGMPQSGPPRAVAIAAETSLIVANVPRDVYNAASIEAQLSDLDWVAAAGAAHHTVVDALAVDGAVVLPFRLFTIFSNEQKAVATMRGKAAAIRRVFDRVRGREEWVLRIGKSDPGRIERGSRAHATTGTDFLAQKADARREDRERAARVKHDAAAAYETLKGLAEAAAIKTVDPAGTLLLDAAFLLRPAQVESMKEALMVAADRLLRDGCPVSLTGPWPAYSFASLEADSDG
jgi:hypothetical protein